MSLLKIFKKYQLVILFVVFVYFFTSLKENLASSPNLEYKENLASSSNLEYKESLASSPNLEYKESLASSPNLKYTKIINSICSDKPNKDECVESFKIRCSEDVCRGKVGEDKDNCETKCNNISL